MSHLVPLLEFNPFRLSPLIDWIFGLWATPKMAPHLVHQFWGSNSDAVSQLLVREVILAEQVEVLPGNRRAMATASRNASRLAVSLISFNFCER